MKQLFKNAFKSFAGSKIGLIVLAIIMFITTATVTLFVSVSSSFDKSYSQVEDHGAIHDFTVNEKYSLKGNDGLSETQDVGAGVSSFGIKGSTSYSDNDYLYIDVHDLTSMNWSGSNSPKLRIKKADLLFEDTDGDGFADSLANTAIDISLSTAKDGEGLTIGGSTISLDHNGHSKPFGDLHYSTFASYDASTPKNAKLYHHESGWIFKTIEDLKFVGDFSAFKNNLFKVIENKQLIEQVTKHTYTFALDSSVISGSYKDSMDKLTQGITFDQWVNSVIGSSRTFDSEDKAKEALAKLKKTLSDLAIIGMSTKFKDEITTKYAADLYETDVSSLTVNAQKNIFKVVDGQKNKDVDKLVMFDGQAPSDSADEYYTDKNGFLLNENGGQIIGSDGNPTKDIRDPRALSKSMFDGVTKVAKAVGSFPGNNKLLIYSKKYKYTYTWDKKLALGHSAPVSISFYDPTAFEAAVTPGYVSRNDLKTIDPTEVEKLIEEGNSLVLSGHEGFDFTSWLRQQVESDKYKDSVVWVDQTPYFITGTGTTPDFSFPIIDGANPIPDTHTQAVLFTNPSGYQRIVDAFRGNPRENYLAYKFKPGVSAMRQDQIIRDIEQIANASMTWGNNLAHIVSRTNDTTEKVNLAPQRVTFLVKIQKTISAISYTTIALLILFTAFVVVIVVKKQISSRRKNLGILMANGYSKYQIATSNMVLGLIIAFIPSVLGYLLGHFFQYALLDIFDSTWTLPITGHEFSWVALLLTVAAPIAGVCLLTFLITLWELKGSIVSILSGANSKFSDSISARILGPLKWVGIRTKSSMSLFLSNMSKMIMILVSSAAATIALSMSISTIHKFDQAKNDSLAATSYTYKLDLVSPTQEGGAFKQTSISNIGTDISGSDDTDNIYKDTEAMDVVKKAEYDKAHFHVPSQEDETYQHDINYLKNKVQFQALLNVFAGGFGQGQNPWKTARNLMPENQLNLAVKRNINFINLATKVYKDNHGGKTPSFVKQDSEHNYKVQEKDVNDSFFGFELAKNYKEFIYNGLCEAIHEYQKTGEIDNMPFFISYNNIITGDNDELYTSIKGSVNLKDIHGRTSESEISIDGINDNSKMISISKNQFEKISSYNGNNIPVIANKYFLENYGLKVGSVFDMSVINNKDRYQNGAAGLIVHHRKIEIVGTQNSYNDSKLYTSRKLANEALGWDTTTTEGKNMFNGIFTNDENSIIFNSISLYSQSGFYPSTSTLLKPVSTGKTKNQYEVLADKLKSGMASNPAVKGMDDYISTYTNSPYVMDYSDVNWSQADVYKFDTTLDLSSKLILVIEIIIILMAILFVAVIASMMVSDNKRFISTMKVMGYRSGEISRIFFGSFIPSLIIALVIAVPVSVGLIFGLKAAIMSFGSILVPLTLTWWSVTAAFLIVLAGIWFVYWLSSRELKNTSLLHAFA